MEICNKPMHSLESQYGAHTICPCLVLFALFSPTFSSISVSQYEEYVYRISFIPFNIRIPCNFQVFVSCFRWYNIKNGIFEFLIRHSQIPFHVDSEMTQYLPCLIIWVALNIFWLISVQNRKKMNETFASPNLCWTKKTWWCGTVNF